MHPKNSKPKHNGPREKQQEHEEHKEVQPIDNAPDEASGAAQLDGAKANPGREVPDAQADEHEDLTKRLLYLQAEFENYKKRLLREQEQAIRSANERLVRDLLPITDLFDHALNTLSGADLSVDGISKFKEFIAGIELTHRELVQVLRRFGVELVGTEGEKFNPERHEAISEMEAAPEKAGTILAILHKGCLLNGRLVEPAKVVVAKAREIEPSSQKED